jgi:hypothetical protein
MVTNSALEKISLMEASWYEEDSFQFLAFYQSYKNWFVYDSKEIGISSSKALANNFISFHGKIPFPNFVSESFDKDQISAKFWSAVPLGVFRYKMLETGACYLIDSAKDMLGYIVEGVYWDNGFVYLVRDKSEIIQIKLFIDEETKAIHGYPSLAQ